MSFRADALTGGQSPVSGNRRRRARPVPDAATTDPQSGAFVPDPSRSDDDERLSDLSIDCARCSEHLGRYAEHAICQRAPDGCRVGVCRSCHPDMTITYHCPVHHSAAASGDPGSTLATVIAMSESRAREWATRAVAADTRSPRYWIPDPVRMSGRLSRLACDLASAALEGSAAAEIILSFLPRIILRRGQDIFAAIAALTADTMPAVAPANPGHGPDERRLPAATTTASVSAWARRVGAAAEDGRRVALGALLERGPPLGNPDHPDPAFLDDKDVFPDFHAAGDEAATFTNVFKDASELAVKAAFSGRQLRRWAITHVDKCGGTFGWCGRTIRALDGHVSDTGAPFSDLLAAVWSRPLHRWASKWLVDASFRALDGWLIPRADKTPRPVSAPQLPRRLWSAADARRVRSAAAAYCEQGRQYGLSGDAVQLAYSLVPALVVANGGTTVSGDRANSYQSFARPAVIEAAAGFVRWARDVRGDLAAAASAARLVSTCFLDGAHGLPPSTVLFARQARTITVAGLPQGCSSSPTLQALTLAGPLRNDPPPRGVLRDAAHDDVQITCLGIQPPNHSIDPSPAELRVTYALPDLSTVGGEYNANKSVAVGRLADAAVAAGAASSSKTSHSVWGRPVGSPTHWFHTSWLPRFHTRLTSIRAALRIDAGAAISAFMSLGGPGAMATHWLRATPLAATCPAFAADILTRVDDEWIALARELAGQSADAAGSTDVRPLASRPCPVRAAVFGLGNGSLGHLAAADVAQWAPYAGLALAWTHAASAADHVLHADWRVWATQLGVSNPPDLQSPQTAADAFSRLATTRRAGVDLGRSTLGRSAPLYRAHASSELDGANSRPVSRPPGISAWNPPPATSLWVSAIQAGPTLIDVAPTAPQLAHDFTKVAPREASTSQVALAKVLGLPLWGPFRPGAAPPIVCGRCYAQRPSDSAARGVTSVPPRTQLTRPSKQFDDNGCHIAACPKLPLLASPTWRHDRMCDLLAAIASSVGRGGYFHNRPVIASTGLKPADYMEDPISAAMPRGHMVDYTNAAGSLSDARGAEATKQRKYASLMSQLTGYSFEAFGTAEDGSIGPGAASVCKRWSQSMKCSARTAGRGYVVDTDAAVMRTVGRAFVAVAAAQIAKYLDAAAPHYPARRDGLRTRASEARASPKPSRDLCATSASTPTTAPSNKRRRTSIPPPTRATSAPPPETVGRRPTVLAKMGNV